LAYWMFSFTVHLGELLSVVRAAIVSTTTLSKVNPSVFAVLVDLLPQA